MFVIYSNESNPFTLKLLIAANLAGKSFDLKIVNLRDASIPEPKHLPCLQHEDRSLFMANAAAYYLLPPGSSHESIVDLWLEWESAVLAPTLLANFATAGKGQSSKSTLKTSLKTLNDAVGSNLSLIAEDLNVCDVVIWSTLYPFYKDTNLSKEYFTDLDNLNNWFQKLESKPEFQKSLTQYKVNPGSASYQVLSISTKLILGQPTAAVSSSNSVLSPQHSSSGDSVTPEEIEAARSAWENGGSALPKVKEDKALVLPVPGEKNILITSALPYVNNVPHLGNIIGCVLSADVFARFNRLCNYNTLYVCGTDEYGTATETKALEENLTPQQICDKYFEVHNSIYRWFNIGFDYFGRTTTPEQTQITQEIFLQLNNNGFMQTQLVDQLLCEKCNRFLADRFVEGGCPHPGCNYEDARGDQCDGCGKLVNATELKNPRCKACGTPPVGRKSSQFFLDLPKLEPLLRHWMNKSSPGWSNNARIIANSWMKEGLKPRCITRDLKWGIPVPIEGYTDKVFYVWFDAPIGYLSISARYTKEWKQWWKPAPNTSVELYQFMAKDNVPFHSVMFPAAMLGLNDGYTTVSHIMATEYLNYEDGKFSKSRGIGVFGNDAQNTGIPSDVWRFYLLYVRPENQDSSFSWIDLATKTNSELLNNLGNFVNRAQVFAEKFFDGIVPNMVLDNDDYSFLALCTRELREFTSSLSKAKLRDGIRHILSISRHGNLYMQSSAPWVLIKGSEKEKVKAGTVIGLCCNITCLLTTLLFPYMPETSRILKTQLNAPPGVSVLIPENPVIVNLLPAGHKLGKPSPLFSKIEAAKVEELKKQFAGKQQPLPSNPKTVSPQTAANPPQQQNGVVDPQEVEKLKIELDKQALLVKNLKDGGAARTEWQPHLEVLLNLKNKLALLTGEPQAQQKKKKGKK